ncbi:MAG: hypothetical protein AAF570_26965, partial [Bacteroidota bacterium]
MLQNIKRTTLTLICCLIASLAVAQHVPSILSQNNTTIRDKVRRVADAGWLYMKKSAQVRPNDLFTNLKSSTGLGPHDDMQITETWRDKYGWNHQRYQQFYKQVRVENAQWSEHWKDCFVEISHGKLVENLNLSVQANLTEQQALASAMNHIGATEYIWQNTGHESALQQEMNDPNATHHPSGELMVAQVQE